jgi:hypothetical protein
MNPLRQALVSLRSDLSSVENPSDADRVRLAVIEAALAGPDLHAVPSRTSDLHACGERLWACDSCDKAFCHECDEWTGDTDIAVSCGACFSKAMGVAR